MSTKNLDQLIGDLNSLYTETPKIDTQKIAKEYYDKTLREQKTLRNDIIMLIVLVCSLYYIIAKDIYDFVNAFTLISNLCLFLFLTRRSAKRIKNINKGQSFIDYENSKKETAKILLKQFKIMKKIVYASIVIVFTLFGVKHYHNYDWIVFWASLPFMFYGIKIALKAINSSIKDYQEIIEE